MSIGFGQTSAEIMRQGTNHGFSKAMLVSLGAFLAEFILLGLAITGFIFFFKDPQLLKFVWIIGGFVVLYLGIKGIVDYKNSGKPTHKIAKSNTNRPFINGLTINFINPLNVVFWSVTLGPIVLESVQKNGFFIATIDGIAVPLGGMVWWIILSSLSAFAGKSLHKRFIEKINLISLFGFILLGIYFLYRAYGLFF